MFKDITELSLNNLVEGFMYTVLSAGFVALVAWLYSWIRNCRLETSLSKAVSSNGVGVGFDPSTCEGSFNIQIHNYSTSTIRVRSLVMVADKFHIELQPSLERTIYQTPLSNEIVRPKFARQYLSMGSLAPDNNPHAMLLPPKTMGVWEALPQVIGTREWVIEKIYMVVEYATVFGNSALVRIQLDGATLQAVKESFEPLAKAVHNKQPLVLLH